MLTLSSREQRHLEDSLQCLLSPFSHSQLDAWRRDASRRVKSLLGADMATFFLRCAGAEIYFSEDYGRETWDGYPHKWNEPGLELSRQEEWQANLGVYTRRTLYGPRLQALYRSNYYAYAISVRAYDSLGMTFDPRGDGQYAGLMFHHDSAAGRRFGSRGVQMLRLLYPSFKSGISSYVRLSEGRQTFVRTIDDLNDGIALFDLLGRQLHANRALVRLLSADPEGERVRSQVEAAARAFRHAADGRDVMDLARMSSQKVTTQRGAYTLRTSYVGTTVTGHDAILVVLDHGPDAVPLASTLRERFGLTTKEALVTALLMERRSNHEVAAVLGMSTHTARHHTESVLLKLGIHSRLDVDRAVRSALARPQA